MKEYFECHGHLMMDGADYRNAKRRHQDGVDREAVRRELAALKEAGVIYFREGGDALGVSAAAAELAPEYGIEYRTPAFAIHRKGHYGGIVGRSFSGGEQYRERVREAKEAGADFIKLIVSGILTFRAEGELSCPSLPADEILEMVKTAHGEGFAVMMHVNGAEAIRAAVQAGTDSIEHGCFMDEETMELLCESRTIWVPTIAAIEAFDGREGFDAGATHRIAVQHLERVRKAAEKGARIACGSDSGAVGVPHGPGTLREYELLKEAGVSEEALRKTNEELRARFKRD